MEKMSFSLLPIGTSKTPENSSKIVFLLQGVEGLGRPLRTLFYGSEDKDTPPTFLGTRKAGRETSTLGSVSAAYVGQRSPSVPCAGLFTKPLLPAIAPSLPSCSWKTSGICLFLAHLFLLHTLLSIPSLLPLPIPGTYC